MRESFAATNLLLVARQTLRVDAALQVGQMSQQVTVESTEAGVINTESQVIQETFDPQQLLNLPANIRANGNTSPYQLIQVLPGVQTDDGVPPNFDPGWHSVTDPIFAGWYLDHRCNR